MIFIPSPTSFLGVAVSRNMQRNNRRTITYNTFRQPIEEPKRSFLEICFMVILAIILDAVVFAVIIGIIWLMVKFLEML